MSGVPPGWYQNDDGQWHYWDGTGWDTSAPPFAYPPQQGPLGGVVAPTHQPKKRKWPVYLASVVGGALLVAAGFFGMMFIASSSDEDKDETSVAIGAEEQEPQSEATTRNEDPTPSERPTTQRPAEPTKSQAQVRDEGMERDGFMVYESGETYLRFLTDQEAAQNPCGRYDCVDVIILSVSGCPGGFYVRADILSNGTPVSWTNEMTASAQAHEQIFVRLEDYRDIGDEIRISEINCHRF